MSARRATVQVPLADLDCRDCARAVHAAVRDVPGIELVVIDDARREARVDLDPARIGEAEVRRLVRSAVAAARAARHPPPPAFEARAHGHDHDHGHAHHHREASLRNRNRLFVVLLIGVAVMAAEVVGGLLSGSLVLLSDAAHVFTDVSAIALAALAVTWATRPATREKTYGFHRAEIVAAFVNALALWVVAAYFIYEAVRRLQAPPDVDGRLLTLVAAGGLVANVVMAVVLHRGAGESLNVRSAYVHVLSDLLGSAAALVAGLGILWRGWTWLDPATTLLVSGLILVWTFRLTRECLHILLEGTPERMDTEALRSDMLAVEGVTEVHDLHVWTLTTGVDSMSAHIRVADTARGPEIVRAVRSALAPKWGLGHVTLEVEAADAECASCR